MASTAMGKTEQIFKIAMAQRGIRNGVDLAKRVGLTQGRISQIMEDIGGLPCRTLLAIADILKLTDEELGRLVRSQR